MPEYRSIAIEDPRFPDGRGVLLAWDSEVVDDRELTMYLFASALRFFVHLDVSDTPRSFGFLELDIDAAARMYARLAIKIVPFPSYMIDLGMFPWHEPYGDPTS